MYVTKWFFKRLLSKPTYSIDAYNLSHSMLSFKFMVLSIAILIASSIAFSASNNSLLLGFFVVMVILSLIAAVIFTFGILALLEDIKINGIKNLENLFEIPPASRLDYDYLVRKVLTNEEQKKLFRNNHLLASFRVGLFDVIQTYLDNVPKGESPDKLHILNLVTEYTKRFRDLYLVNYDQLKDCQIKQAYEKALEKIDKLGNIKIKVAEVEHGNRRSL